MDLTAEYIRGLVAGEGTFSFSPSKTRGGKVRLQPQFVLKMHVRDKELLRAVRNYWKLEGQVYEYTHGGRHYAMLIVRTFGDLKNVIVPFFYKKLRGHKTKQFEEWLEKLGDPRVGPDFRLIYRLYKKGFYDNPKNYLYHWE